MKVKNKELYHYHNTHSHNDIWVEGNKITIDDNFETNFLKILKLFTTAVDTTNGEKQNFDNIIKGYLDNNLCKSKEDYIKLLNEAKYIIKCTNIFKRELALEMVRKEKYPHLPSRKHSIWLCDKKSLDFWKKQLSDEEDDIDLYKVSVTGNLFKTSDLFIPNDTVDFETNLLEAEKYWSPKFTSIIAEERTEYLFQGDVKILKKVNNIYK